MLHYQAFQCNMLGENAYLLWDDDRHAAFVDCGAFFDEEKEAIAAFAESRSLIVEHHYLTHGHFDHVFGLPFIHRTYGLRPVMHTDEADTYRQMPGMAAQFGLNVGGGIPPIGRLANDGEEVRLGKTAVRFIHTPGHTPGSASLYIADAGLLLSGDTLFQGSLGRTDLPGGCWEDEVDSIRNKLFLLPDDTTVLCGHGQDTTIGSEKRVWGMA